MAKKNNFEDKIEKSKEILEKLMDPSLNLSDGMKFYKQGVKELKEASKLLEDAQLEYEEIK